MVAPKHLKDAVESEGEVHAIIEEYDKELEIRKGQVDWCDGESHFVVESKTERVTIGEDRVVSWYVPNGIWH